MRLTRGATYVVGGRVGMDDTHYFKWDLVLLLHSYSLYIYTPPPPFWGYDRSLSPSLAPPPPENLHSARSCPKKVEKTSSENTTFAKSEHPYRTCGSLGGIFSSSIFQFSIKNLSFRSWLSLKSRKNVKRKHVFQKNAFGCGLSLKSRKNVKRKHYFSKFGAPLSHFRPLGGIFCFLGFSSFWLKTYHSVRGYP